MRKILFMIMALFAAQAMARIFPPNARFGEIDSVAATQVEIDSKTFRPAPGLRVFNQQGAIVFLRQLPVDTLVAYQLDGRGELYQVWMLTADEIRQKGPKQAVINNSSD